MFKPLRRLCAPASLSQRGRESPGLLRHVSVSLFTNYLTPYRVPLYCRLAERHGLEVICFGRGERYLPEWFGDLDAQLSAVPFVARQVAGPLEAARAARSYDVVIAGFAGGAVLPAVYAAARARNRTFVLWASVWVEPISVGHRLARPVTRHIYRHADAVLTYGEHVRRFVGGIRGRTDDVVVAAQAVEPELFAKPVNAAEVTAFRAEHGLGGGPLVVYVGRLVAEKGIEVLLRAFDDVASEATLVLIGSGPLAEMARGRERVRLLGPLPRERLAIAYAAAEATVLVSVPRSRFCEPWGMVLNEAMLGGRPVIASDGVGAVAGGLVRDGHTGLVVPANEPAELAVVLDRLLRDPELRARLGDNGRRAATELSYDAAAQAFDHAIELGRAPKRSR